MTGIEEGSEAAARATVTDDPSTGANSDDDLRVGVFEDGLEGAGLAADPAFGPSRAREDPSGTETEADADDEGLDAPPDPESELSGDVVPGAETADVDALVRRARRAQRAGKTSAATGLYRRALAVEPRNTRALVGLGAIYFNRSKYRTAVKYLKRAVAISPRKADYRLSLGDAHYKLGEYEKARKHYAVAKARGSAAAAKRLKRVDERLSR
jgi:tetratricopeptide (TPR) repeat protein